MALNSSNCSQLWACNTGSYFTTWRLTRPHSEICLGDPSTRDHPADSSTLWPGFIQSCRFFYAVTRVHPELPIPLCCDQGSSSRFLYAVHPELPIPLRCDQGSTRVADPSTLWPGFIQSCWSLYAVHPELPIPLRCSSRVADSSTLWPGFIQSCRSL